MNKLGYISQLRKLIEDCDNVGERYKSGKITVEEAMKELAQLEIDAYELDEHAEPDGDYTYTVATKMGEIFELEKNKKNEQKKKAAFKKDNG